MDSNRHSVQLAQFDQIGRAPGPTPSLKSAHVSRSSQLHAIRRLAPPIDASDIVRDDCRAATSGRSTAPRSAVSDPRTPESRLWRAPPGDGRRTDRRPAPASPHRRPSPPRCRRRPSGTPIAPDTQGRCMNRSTPPKPTSDEAADVAGGGRRVAARGHPDWRATPQSTTTRTTWTRIEASRLATSTKNRRSR